MDEFTKIEDARDPICSFCPEEDFESLVILLDLEVESLRLEDLEKLRQQSSLSFPSIDACCTSSTSLIGAKFCVTDHSSQNQFRVVPDRETSGSEKTSLSSEH